MVTLIQVNAMIKLLNEFLGKNVCVLYTYTKLGEVKHCLVVITCLGVTLLG